MKYKIKHIHTDIKFVSGVNIFNDEKFHNEVFLFSKQPNYDGVYKGEVSVFNYSKNDINRAISLCQEADIVVMWDLEFVKSYITNRLNENVKVIWRFFGTELYNKIPKYVFTTQTTEVKKKNTFNSPLIRTFKASILKKNQQVKYQTTLKIEFEGAVRRANYFLGLSDTEYQFLKERWPELPPFLQNPFPQMKSNEDSESISNDIILGNSRNDYNNHLDILDIIENSKSSVYYNYHLMFNYGKDNTYAKAVRERAVKLEQVKVIEEFLPIEEFRELYKSISAFVLNGHRQMAMANVFQALRNNVKIYLNEKNVILDWLRKEGFLVYTIDDFASDIENNNIKLNESEIIHNKNRLKAFGQKYNHTDFKNKLLKIITENEAIKV